MFIKSQQKIEDKKNGFIVSHSNFMKQLVKIIGIKEKLYFDNLDCLVLGFNNEKYSNNYLTLRYKDNYKLDNEKIQKLNQFDSILIIMRHCIACHNIMKDIKVERVKERFIKGVQGFDNYSICVNILQELNKDDIVNNFSQIFNISQKWKYNDFYFGSSVILRAILTSFIFHRLINDHLLKQLSQNGGNKIKSVRKHRGIYQSGPKAGKLRPGFKYTNQKTKSGLKVIVESKKK